MSRILFHSFRITLGLCLVTAAQAFPPNPTPAVSVRVITRQMLEARGRLLTQHSFLKDIARNHAEPSVYLSQFQKAQKIYRQLTDPSLTTFSSPQRNLLKQQIDQLVLVDEQTRQLWKGIITHRLSPEARGDMATYFQDYFGFDTENDVSLLPENDLSNSPYLRELQNIYSDFAKRFKQFVETHHRLPMLRDTNVDSAESLLSQEYQLFCFVNRYHQFEPLQKYIKQIEEIAKSIK